MKAMSLAFLLLVSGCDSDPEQLAASYAQSDASRARIEEKLPSGCTLHDLGTYYTRERYPDRLPIVIIDCGSTTTNVTARRSGKSTKYQSSVNSK